MLPEPRSRPSPCHPMSLHVTGREVDATSLGTSLPSLSGFVWYPARTMTSWSCSPLLQSDAAAYLSLLPWYELRGSHVLPVDTWGMTCLAGVARCGPPSLSWSWVPCSIPSSWGSA